jgi:hydroxymethylpyrimidine kinase/phosphomethylpyrimidine kinase
VSPPIVASIGTTHPWNIAGVGLDAHVAAEYGALQVAAVAAVSAQDEHGLHALESVAPEVLRAQLECLPNDVAAFRIGALVSSQNVRVVTAFLRDRAANVPVVVDPVISVTLGGELRADDTLLATLVRELLILPVIVTPNLLEAAQILDMPVDSVDDMRRAGQRLVKRGARAAFIKGGHLQGEPVDVLVSAQGETAYPGERIAGSMRGSGCTFAAALACELAFGRDLIAAAGAARAYVRAKITAGTVRNGLQVAF